MDSLPSQDHEKLHNLNGKHDHRSKARFVTAKHASVATRNRLYAGGRVSEVMLPITEDAVKEEDKDTSTIMDTSDWVVVLGEAFGTPSIFLDVNVIQ